MIDLTGYTGQEPNELATRTMEALSNAGFRISASSLSPNPAERTVIRIYWRSVFVGKLHHYLWSIGFSCMYRFAPSESGMMKHRFGVPRPFDIAEFARVHGVPVRDLDLRVEPDESYLRARTVGSALRLMLQKAHEVDGTVFHESGRDDPDQLREDLNEIENSNLTGAEKDVLAKARLGQGRFRKLLDQEFDGRCATTGLTLRAALRGSHIVPWRESDPTEKVDPRNGLLLSANVDALFDRYMLTFDEGGHPLLSEAINSSERAMLWPMLALDGEAFAVRSAYLARHRKKFYDAERLWKAFALQSD
jgi:hypothetical protein